MNLPFNVWQKPLLVKSILSVFVLLLCSNQLFADGSRNLYPSGVSGVRAHLRSSTTATVNWPFPNQGYHYVYAKAGERITMASSAQISGTSSRIRLYSPSGTLVVDDASSNGQIANRTAELAGPQLVSQTGGNRYTPIYYQVPTGGDGIYRVEFWARGTGTSSTTVNANANWTQASDSSIMAWDVSVINTGNTAFISGRVYANVLNLNNGTGNYNTTGFYGILYALTKDGYTYRVNNNGNNGMYFTFFVNNNGFIDSSGQPIYKSLSDSSPSNLADKVHDPNAADTSNQITHKMFYTLPSTDLPATSVGAVPGGSTWLKTVVVVPVVTGITLEGVEGTPQQIGNLKGGYIKFNADVQGNYEVVIGESVPGYATRVLTGSSVAGANQIYWDGKDGNGNPSPPGTAAIGTDVTVRLQSGEVHFPFIDMEYNRSGFILELLDHTNLNNVVSNIVYWDDTDIPSTSGNNGSTPSPKNNSHLPPTNSTGQNSTTNGHIWGVGGNTGTTFGNERAIDTWTFIKAEETTVQTNAVVTSADLKVSSIAVDKTEAYVGDEVVYTIKVKNDGPSDVSGATFTFLMPDGFSPHSVVFTGNSCGTEAVAISYDAVNHVYASKLNLPDDCEITYDITITVNNLALAGNQFIEATILRPNDVSDPDATNPDITVMPTDAHDECSNNGLGGTCNNILNNNELEVILACHYDANTNVSGIPAAHGITLLKRAGATGGWPTNKNSAYMVLESNTKGFVITRMTSDPAQISAANYISNDSNSKITNPQEGMMVYDEFENCLKIYSDGAWKCFTVASCP